MKRKTLYIQFVTKVLNDMRSSTISIFSSSGSSLRNPGPTGTGAVILRAGINKPPIKLAKVVSSNSTNDHGEVDAILLALKYILSAQSQVSANTIHIFSNSIAEINVITSLSLQAIDRDNRGNTEISWNVFLLIQHTLQHTVI